MSNRNNLNLSGILGGIAAIITALGSVYAIYIGQQNKTDEVDNNRTKKSETKYKCSIEGRKLRIDENWDTSPGWEVHRPGLDPSCEFDIIAPDGIVYCVSKYDNEIVIQDDIGELVVVGSCIQI